ncbi:nuclear transport factor 2 family protein [Trujillonella endophytica]|uniref:SnoaL-like domain-containing protein n=1 Tax=Trujillonella endophytica TaxID=673521 RepID=A0A1H8UQF2_9ACTN|nr:nuclear transport factor 2 family protein [Trujillella endophytica]SEP05144.1 SnoaL-like domain-containing protein [Trujillella endophytica]
MAGVDKASVDAGVRAAIAALSRAQDAGRPDDLVALYTADATLELPGADPVVGAAALREAFAAWAPKVPQLHLVGNVVVTPGGPDEATAVSDVAMMQRGESGWAVRIVGRYRDTFLLQGDGWRLHRRSTTFSA